MRWLALLLFLLAACESEIDVTGLPSIEGYESWSKTPPFKGEIPGHGDSVRTIYRNDFALSYPHGGRYPIGSVLVKEIADNDDGKPGKLRYVGVMRKIGDDHAGLPVDDGWLFTYFEEAGGAEEEGEGLLEQLPQGGSPRRELVRLRRLTVTMKLYYIPQTRSSRPRWMLEELGVPYELHRLDVSTRENRQPPYTTLNPLGHVPTFVDGDVVIFESLAICLYLADKYIDKGLAPPLESPDRGTYYKWCVFSMVTVEKAVDQVNQHTVRLPEAERVASVAEAGRARFREIAAVLDKELEGKEYLVGGRFTTADLMMASVVGWAKLLGLLGDHPRLQEYVRRQVSRPAAKASRKD